MFDTSNFIKPSDIQPYLPKPVEVEENPTFPTLSVENKGRLFQLKAACSHMLSLFKRYLWEVRITRQLNRNIAVLNKKLKEKSHSDLYFLVEGVNQLKEVCLLLKKSKVNSGRLEVAERSLDYIRNQVLLLRHVEGAKKLKEIANQILPEETQATVEELHEALNDLLTSVVKNPTMKKQLDADDYEVIRKWQATQKSSAEYTPSVLAALSKVINQDPEFVIKYVPICFDIGCYYHFDEDNLIVAVAMYRLAAEYGHPGALRNLGYCFEMGIGCKENLQMAATCYYRAASQGDIQAQCNLAYFFEVGKGVKQDEKMAAQLYAAAAEEGSARAQCNLGYCYAQGKGVEKDQDRAVRLYEVAARQNYPQAQCNLAHCYEVGQGVGQDLTKAIDLYRLAAEQGNVAAKEHLEQLVK